MCLGISGAQSSNQHQKEITSQGKPLPDSTLPFANGLKSFLTTEVQEADLEIKDGSGHSAGDGIILGEPPLGGQQRSLEELPVLI